jgi:hypothetical protein
MQTNGDLDQILESGKVFENFLEFFESTESFKGTGFLSFKETLGTAGAVGMVLGASTLPFIVSLERT